VRALLALIVLATGLALPALAHASPPDPSWIPGVYDDADFDDVVVRVTSATGSVDPEPPDAPCLAPGPAERVGHRPEPAPGSRGIRADRGRAPSRARPAKSVRRPFDETPNGGDRRGGDPSAAAAE